MPPLVALFLWFVLLLLLFHFDPAKDPEVSSALWVPVIWISIIASRLPSQWLGVKASLSEALEEGNMLDRMVWIGLIVLAAVILNRRAFHWGDFIARNTVLMGYVLFALFSVLWSDFAFVAFKRWFRDLGSYLIVLIILSDPNPEKAVGTVLRRVSYLLIPLSIVLVKYFEMGRLYDPWSGVASVIGVATSKNMLGVLCLISGLFFYWDTAARWSDPKGRSKNIILVNLAFAAMTLWLLYRAHSITSTVCLCIGCIVIASANGRLGQQHGNLLKVGIPACFCLYLILGFGFGLNGRFAAMLGRDPTLTDRTKIWSLLLGMHTNPLIGTGYESFWLGSRLDQVFAKTGASITEAHNGYLEIYLNLGFAGLLLLIGILIAAYRNISQRHSIGSAFTSLKFAFWTVAVFFNVTEAGFKHGLMWLAVLFGAISLRAVEDNQVLDATTHPDALAEEQAVVVSSGEGEWSSAL